MNDKQAIKSFVGGIDSPSAACRVCVIRSHNTAALLMDLDRPLFWLLCTIFFAYRSRRQTTTANAKVRLRSSRIVYMLTDSISSTDLNRNGQGAGKNASWTESRAPGSQATAQHTGSLPRTRADSPDGSGSHYCGSRRSSSYSNLTLTHVQTLFAARDRSPEFVHKGSSLVGELIALSNRVLPFQYAAMWQVSSSQH